MGVNASDINWTAGRYIPDIKPPFDTGFEGLGQVAQVGQGCVNFRPGDAVSFMRYGSFSEYLIVPAKHTFPIPRLDPGYVPDSSRTAEESGRLPIQEWFCVHRAKRGA